MTSKIEKAIRDAAGGLERPAPDLERALVARAESEGLLDVAYASVDSPLGPLTVATTPAGTRVPFRAITGLGKKRWDSKGIAVVRYELQGRKGEFIVDDYKFEAEPARKILDEIESELRARTESVPGAAAD